MSSRPDLIDLTAFAAIVVHRSVRKAAGGLNLSPATLSYMIRVPET